MKTETKMNPRRVVCCFGKKSMKAHLGRRGFLDENVIHIRDYQDPPSYSQESHNRFKDLRKHSRAMTEPKGKQKSRTKVNLKGKLYPLDTIIQKLLPVFLQSRVQSWN